MERKKRITLVLLAAGDSRRFGGNKLLSELEGKPMYRHVADQIASLGPEVLFQKILVTQYGQIAADLEREGYQVVINRESCLGISHSIQLAVACLDDQADAACFCVCDQPWLKAETIEALLNGWKRSEKGLGCVSSDGEPGNPSVFAKAYWKELETLTGDRGGKRIIKDHPEDVFLYEAEDPQELEDIDVRVETKKYACHVRQDSL